MNKNILSFSIGLLLGSGSGFVAGYFFSKNKYLAMAEKEIDSVKKVYEKHFTHETNRSEVKESPMPSTSVTTKKQPTTNDPIKEYKQYASMYNKQDEAPKINVSTSSVKTKKVSKKPVKMPYVISPDEFQVSDYDTNTLMWYSDKILADTDGNVIHNSNEVIGPEALSTFGRYLDDTVYVRDDEKQVDYEIIWDSRKYSSVNKLSGDRTLKDDDSTN